ncbi:MAG: hypothetical protein MPL62_17285, partial [Alphaproteobacteria bacterium]|nr:hypothetical protein [Alphaproteobacteria bacterium]
MAMIDYIQDVMPSLAGIPNPGGALGALIGSVDSIESTLKDFSEPLTTRIEEKVDDEGRVIREGKSAYEEYGDDFTVALEEGDISAGADLLIGDVVEALPSVAAAFTGIGGLTVIGASAFGNKYTDEFNEAVDQGKPVDTNRIFGAAFVTGAGEFATEAFTAGLGKGVVSVASKLGPKVATAVARNAAAKIGFATVGEGFSEGLADTIERGADDLILGKTDAWDGAVRSFFKNAIVGGIIGGGIGTTQLNDNTTARSIVEAAIKPHAIQESQNQAAARVNALYSDLQSAKENGDELLASAIQDEINYYENAIVKSQHRYSEQTDNLSPEQVKQLADVKSELDTYQQIQNSPDFQEVYDDAARDVINRKIEDLKNKQAEIFTQPDLKDAKASKPISKKNQK